ncbi:MAG TPA: class I SAM-dependent methyltransferase [Verrucomicrobiales bacterium]|nr:class I SAM-dependent methyltransferase [Verrucomicrobiales bacterium]HIL72442.1 class I SAM-dependent methyltransferase [Verrucomicrobiota bacterium]
MGHQETYLHNESYAEFLDNWDESFYAKYADNLIPATESGKALDVGCGTGQVIRRLKEKSIHAFGVDVSQPNIERAKKISDTCSLYDGKILPFEEDEFDSAGALNVLEHVEQPEDFIKEMIRVVKPGGKIILSSPNFHRVIGFRDYHPRMRGVLNKVMNARRLMKKKRGIRDEPKNVRFDRMTPIIKEPFSPDDDAIVATNALEMEFFLSRYGCHIRSVSCTDRYVSAPINWLLNLTLVRYLMFNAFIVAEKKAA